MATYNSIETKTITGSSTTSVTFSSISGYTDLVLICHLKGSATAYPYIRFNSDSGANYESYALYANTAQPAFGSGFGAGGYVAANEIYLSNFIGGVRTGDFSWLSISTIFDYTNTGIYTTVNSRVGSSGNGGSLEQSVGVWKNTAAVTSLSVGLQTGNFVADSVISLYGILGA